MIFLSMPSETAIFALQQERNPNPNLNRGVWKKRGSDLAKFQVICIQLQI
uniref:Uncharacterized protein n=1 Tax=Lotus japonicus TaxID=34305 RepID=I3SB16_LOTJA|nr:unknown [Lotus japonicus]